MYLHTEQYIPLRLSELCKKHDYTRYRLSQLTGMSQTALAKIFSGESIPTIPTLEKLCDALGITLAQFFTKDGVLPDLTEEQRKILEIWDSLESREKEIMFSFVQSLRK